MKTRITELFDIQHPVLSAGMGFVALPELVAAVSNAGGMGVLATSTLSPEETLSSVRRTRELTDKPFAANITMIYEAAPACMQVLIEEKVPVINMSMGINADYVDAIHSYGGKVVSTVVSERHAVSAEKKGADALLVTGHEAAGHGGDASTLVAIPLIAKRVDIPIIAAGGFANGQGLAAALMLGAEAIAMGTRFVNSSESQVHQNVKDYFLKSQVEDTIYTHKIDGFGCRFLATERVATMAEQWSLMQALASIPKVKRALRLSWFDVLISALKGGVDIRKSLGQAQIAGDSYTGLKDGDFEKGIVPGGQSVGHVNSILSAREIVESTVIEAEAAILNRSGKTGSP